MFVLSYYFSKIIDFKEIYNNKNIYRDNKMRVLISKYAIYHKTKTKKLNYKIFIPVSI